ncbi:hypothetical protein BGZ81_002766 [Podila clonocystis]|nr:hypothetical protein BGZ81_002766 [Podila clonocystis]
MSYFTTTTENSFFHDDSHNKPLKTWRDYCLDGIGFLVWACCSLIALAFGLIILALGMVAFLAVSVGQNLTVPDHILGFHVASVKVWLDRNWLGLKPVLWASVSSALLACNLVLLSFVTAAFLVLMGGQLMECLDNGGMLSSLVVGLKEKEWLEETGGFVSNFNSTLYHRQARIETTRVAMEMITRGTFMLCLAVPLCYKVLAYGAVLFTVGPPPPDNNLTGTTRTEERTDIKEHLALVQSAIDRLAAEKKEAERQLVKERAQQKQLEDLFQKYFSLANPASREL